MDYTLPESVEVGGKEYEIRSDYRVALDIFSALSDPEWSDYQKADAVLTAFYPAYSEGMMPQSDYQEAANKCMEFLSNGDGQEEKKKAPKLVDWEQDFKYVIAPINRIIGRDVRADKYMHWWTFLSHYYEIGPDCLFSNIVRIRDKLVRHKVLDKEEKEWYRKNRDLVDIKSRYSEEDMEILKQWGGVKT